MKRIAYCLAGLALLAWIVAALAWTLGANAQWGLWAALGLNSAGLAVNFHPRLRSIAFTVWVVVSVALAMIYPGLFQSWFGYDLKGLIVPLIQIIMFGMGTTLSLADFARVARMPWPIAVGMVLQFTIMPLGGYLIATGFGFPAEIAAGVVLIGSCPGGVASNVMTYLARGNVPLSVTMTACSTLMAPVMTPLMMRLLAGQMVPVDFMEMLLGILNMILLPIVAGLVVNRLFSAGAWIHRALPVVSMAGICLILAIITARAYEELSAVGVSLLAAAVLHNLTGYTLGYWGARLGRLPEADCRTVAIEVGMQNGGMSAGLAMNVLHNAKTALAAVVFGPWMNVSGSLLATWWRRKPRDAPSPE